MNACSVATRPDLEEEEGDRHRERDDAERRDAEEDHEPAAHEQDQQVAGEDVARRDRTESEIRRTKCEITSMTKMNGRRSPGTPAGIKLLR